MEGIIAMILLLLVKETPCAQAQHGFPTPSRNYMSRPQQAHVLAAGLLYQEAPTPVKLISHLAVLRQDVDFHLLTRKMEALNTFQGQIAEKFENMANITKNGNKAWSLQTLPGSTATSS